MSALLLPQEAVPAQMDREVVTSSFTTVEAAHSGVSGNRLPAWLSPETRVRFPASPLPSTVQLLTEGGDARIVCGPNGLNRYGCSAFPEPGVLAFGSSTASTISAAGFAAADALRNRLELAAQFEKPHLIYERELNRVRREQKQLCDLDALPGLEIIFGASGTDLHLFASQLMVKNSEPAPLVVRVESSETGRGVPDALAGRHFSDCSALGDMVNPNIPLDCGRPMEVCEVRCRTVMGNLRPASEIDAEFERAVVRAVEAGRRALITLVDVSKTGIIAPSPGCATALKSRFPDAVEVLVDACQFRLAPATLQAYLELDFMVALTGSKFITGPTFCGALLVPASVAGRLRPRALPLALKGYSARADWPKGWNARTGLKPVPNFGLLLRWEAALTELRAYRRLPEDAIAPFIESFGEAITMRLLEDPHFELLPSPRLDRSALSSRATWDQHPTIFSFLLRREQKWLSPKQTKRVHDLLGAIRCQVGQPVEIGQRDGEPVSALRLCLGSRLIVEALAGRGANAVISDALTVLDKIVQLVASLD